MNTRRWNYLLLWHHLYTRLLSDQMMNDVAALFLRHYFIANALRCCYTYIYEGQCEKSSLDDTNDILVTLFVWITAFRSYKIYFEDKELLSLRKLILFMIYWKKKIENFDHSLHHKRFFEYIHTYFLIILVK